MSIENVRRDVFRTLKWLANNEEVIKLIENDDPFERAEMLKPYKDRNEEDVDFSTEEIKFPPGQMLEMAIWTVPATWRKFAEISKLPYFQVVELVAGRCDFIQPVLDALAETFPNVPTHVWMYVSDIWTDEDAEKEAMRRFDSIAKQELKNE